MEVILILGLAVCLVMLAGMVKRDNDENPGCGTAGLILFVIVVFGVIGAATGGTFAPR